MECGRVKRKREAVLTCASSLCASASSAATVATPLRTPAAFSQIGVSCLQCPHHGAKNSTSTTPFAFNTCAQANGGTPLEVREELKWEESRSGDGERRDLLEVVGVELEDRGAGGVERGGRGGRGGEEEEDGGEDGRTHGVVEKFLEAGGGAGWWRSIGCVTGAWWCGFKFARERGDERVCGPIVRVHVWCSATSVWFRLLGATGLVATVAWLEDWVHSCSDTLESG